MRHLPLITVAIFVIALLAITPGNAAGAEQCGEAQGEACSATVKWGGSVRLRGESWDSFAFIPDADDSFLLGRLLIQADSRLSDTVSIFVQGKSALSSGRDLPGGTRPLDVDTLALQLAIFEARFGPAQSRSRLLLGRQPLQFGRQRLVSPLPWGNSLRAWDGARFQHLRGKWRFDAFYAWYVPVDKYDWNKRNSSEPFFGIYSSYVPSAGRGIDFYWLKRERSSVTINGTSGDEQRDTWGLRLFKSSGAWRGEMEFALQSGSIGSEGISASMISVETSYNWSEGAIESIGGGLDFASGDKSPGGRVETFDQLYPLGHAFLGYMDFIGRQNIAAAFLRARFRIFGSATFEITGLSFQRARTEDALYSPGGGVLRSADAGASRHVGEEIDLALIWPIQARSHLLFGYSHFFPGTFIEQSATSASSDFGYAQLLLSF